MIIFRAIFHKKTWAHVEVICPSTRITLRAEKALRVIFLPLSGQDIPPTSVKIENDEIFGLGTLGARGKPSTMLTARDDS